MHRRNINLTATNKSYTDQGLKFSEPDSGVLSTSIDGLMNHPYKSKILLNSDFRQKFSKKLRILEFRKSWKFGKILKFSMEKFPIEKFW